MSRIKKSHQHISFLLLLIWVTACSNASMDPALPTILEESTITYPSPMVTSTNQLPTETNSPQTSAILPASDTPIPTTPESINTVTPEFSPSPAPLTKTGPWLITSLKDEHEYSPSWQPLIANLDGSGYQILEAVTAGDPINSWWRPEFRISPQGGYLATIALKNQIDFELLIFQLPDTEPIRTIPLMSDASLEAVAQFETIENSACFEFPSVLLSLMWKKTTFQWSPDGRYLAFVGAMDGPNTDVYLYDTQEDHYTRLTAGKKHVSLLSWSPDSQWIVHESVESYCTYTEGPNYAKVDSWWAVSITGKSKNIHGVNASDKFIEWVDIYLFLVASQTFESDLWNLRQINIQTGEIDHLYESSFGAVAVGAKTILVAPIGWWVTRPPDGDSSILQINAALGEPLPILAGKYNNISWYPELALFGTTEKFMYIDNPEKNNNILFTADGEIQSTIFPYSEISPSPNGAWVLTYKINPNSLYDKGTNLIKQFDDNFATIAWLPDSTGFYRCSDHQIYQHLQNDNWATQAIKLPEVSCYPLLIITP